MTFWSSSKISFLQLYLFNPSNFVSRGLPSISTRRRLGSNRSSVEWTLMMFKSSPNFINKVFLINHKYIWGHLEPALQSDTEHDDFQKILIDFLDSWRERDQNRPQKCAFHKFYIKGKERKLLFFAGLLNDLVCSGRRLSLQIQFCTVLWRCIKQSIDEKSRKTSPAVRFDLAVTDFLWSEPAVNFPLKFLWFNL